MAEALVASPDVRLSPALALRPLVHSVQSPSNRPMSPLSADVQLQHFSSIGPRSDSPDQDGMLHTILPIAEGSEQPQDDTPRSPPMARHAEVRPSEGRATKQFSKSEGMSTSRPSGEGGRRRHGRPTSRSGRPHESPPRMKPRPPEAPPTNRPGKERTVAATADPGGQPPRTKPTLSTTSLELDGRQLTVMNTEAAGNWRVEGEPKKVVVRGMCDSSLADPPLSLVSVVLCLCGRVRAWVSLLWSLSLVPAPVAAPVAVAVCLSVSLSLCVSVPRYKGATVAVYRPPAGVSAQVDAETSARIRHVNLIVTLGWLREEGGVEVLVTEWVGGGTLLALLRSPPVKLVPGLRVLIALQISLAMREVVAANSLHRNLCAHNVLVVSHNPITVKVADHAQDAMWERYLGDGGDFPVRWTAPEIFTQRHWSEMSDVYSFGVNHPQRSRCGLWMTWWALDNVF